MNKLRIVLTILIMVSSGSALADDKEGKAGPGSHFEQAKARHIAALTTLLNCVQAAQDRPAMKQCRQQAKSRRQQVRQQRKAKREERRKKWAEREKKWDEREADRDER